MTNMHPSRRHKGCGLCKPWKTNGFGRSYKDPWAVRRKLGKSKRVDRNYLSD